MRPESKKGALLVNTVIEDNFFDECSILVHTGSSDKSRIIIPNNRVKYINDIDHEDFDILISAGWPDIIPDKTLSQSKIASINCHGSFLPDYKGASSYRHMWANCEKEGGASIHFLTSKVDEGNIISQCKFSISNWDSPQDILNKVNYFTAIIFKESLLKIANGCKGYQQSGGRYFFKGISKKRMFSHKVVNTFLNFFGLSALHTPHKIIKPKD